MRPTEPALLTAAAFALSLVLGTPRAVALDPGAMDLKDGGARSRLGRDVHGCHYSCDCGPLKAFGRESVYHRHLHMLCLAVRCDRKHDCEPDPSASPGGDEAQQ